MAFLPVQTGHENGVLTEVYDISTLDGHSQRHLSHPTFSFFPLLLSST